MKKMLKLSLIFVVLFGLFGLVSCGEEKPVKPDYGIDTLSAPIVNEKKGIFYWKPILKAEEYIIAIDVIIYLVRVFIMFWRMK